MNAPTESARYFALCDAREEFAAAVGTNPTADQSRMLDTMDAVLEEQAAKVRETLKPIRYDIGAMLNNLFGVRA